MDNIITSKEELINIYKEDVEKLYAFVPWLETKKGLDMTNYYEGDPTEKASISIPTYDPTLLRFIKVAKETKLMDKNYAFIYSRYHLQTPKEELQLIEKTRIMELPILFGIFSNYIIRGQIRAELWNDAVYNQIFLKIIVRLRELMETWDKPLA